MLADADRAAGLGLALLSAATFGTSGHLRQLADRRRLVAGAAVTVRISIAALVLASRPSAAARPLARAAPQPGMVAGLRPGRGRRLPGVLLQRRAAPVGRGRAAAGVHGHRAGGRLAVAPHGQRAAPADHRRLGRRVVGLVLVLDLIGDAKIDLVGVLWGLGAAVGLAVFFVLSARSDSELPPLAMASGGMAIGAVTLLVAGRRRRAADAGEHRRRRPRRPPGQLAGPGRSGCRSSPPRSPTWPASPRPACWARSWRRSSG